MSSGYRQLPQQYFLFNRITLTLWNGSARGGGKQAMGHDTRILSIRHSRIDGFAHLVNMKRGKNRQKMPPIQSLYMNRLMLCCSSLIFALAAVYRDARGHTRRGEVKAEEIMQEITKNICLALILPYWVSRSVIALQMLREREMRAIIHLSIVYININI